MKNKLTYEEIHALALECRNRSEFKAKYCSAYNAAHARGIMDEVCSHIKTKAHKKWTDKKLIKEASKYLTRATFQNESGSAYMLCRKRGILEQACEHMEPAQENWTKEKVRERALAFTTRSSFQNEDSRAYASALRLGIVDEVCVHMVSGVHVKWTEETIAACALKYSGRYEFKINELGAYGGAVRLGILQQVCSHMKYRTCATVLTEPMYLYYIKITTPKENIPDVWKIGITKHSKIVKGRFAKSLIGTCGNTEIEVIRTWLYPTGYEATHKEKEIMSNNIDSKYYGESPLADTGTTEMFVEDIFSSVITTVEEV